MENVVVESLESIHHFTKFQKVSDEKVSLQKGHLKVILKRKSTCKIFVSA